MPIRNLESAFIDGARLERSGLRTRQPSRTSLEGPSILLPRVMRDTPFRSHPCALKSGCGSARPIPRSRPVCVHPLACAAVVDSAPLGHAPVEAARDRSACERAWFGAEPQAASCASSATPPPSVPFDAACPSSFADLSASRWLACPGRAQSANGGRMTHARCSGGAAFSAVLTRVGFDTFGQVDEFREVHGLRYDRLCRLP